MVESLIGHANSFLQWTKDCSASQLAVHLREEPPAGREDFNGTELLVQN